MYVSLAAYRLLAQLPLGIGDNAEQQHAFLQFGQMLLFRDVHRDGINLLWSLAVRIAQGTADLLQRAYLRQGANHVIAIAKSHRAVANTDIKPKSQH
ncbi:hypothetical protein D3C72_2204580 [compost metagenome]